MHYRIIITGSTSGLGNKLVQLLINETDHSIIALGRNQEKLEHLEGLIKNERLMTVKCDFEKAADIILTSEVIKKSHKNPTPLYIVHCAAMVSIESLKTLTGESLLRVLQVNLVAPFELTRQLLPVMKDSRVLLISTGLVNCSLPDVGAYSMSKAAFYALYRSLNVEFDSDTLIAGVLSPSIFDSPMQESLRGSENFRSSSVFMDFWEKNKLHPTEDIAKFIRTVLLNTSNQSFKGEEWDFDCQEHHRLLTEGAGETVLSNR